MKRNFIEKCYQFISKYQTCDELQAKKIKYGLEGIYNVLTKVIVMAIITIILGIWKSYILLIIFYALARRYAYGLHSKSSITCWILTLTIYIFGSYFIHYAHLQNYIIYFIWCFSFLSFLLLAPADTPKRPLIHKEKRRIQKIKSCIICLIYLGLIFLFQNCFINNAIIYSLFVQSLCINPLLYKITNTPFDNYKTYCKNHGLNF